MDLSTPSTPHLSTRKKLPKSERVEGVHLQEQVADLLPESTQRPVADILTERLTESDSVSHTAPVFIP